MTPSQLNVKEAIKNNEMMQSIHQTSSLINPENVLESLDEWAEDHVVSCGEKDDEAKIKQLVKQAVLNESSDAISGYVNI